MKIEYQTYIGADVTRFLKTVASFRIINFRSFPYLYEGNMEYEIKYLQEFSKNEKAVLVLALHEQEVVGIATGIPLKSEADILADTKQLFDGMKLDISEFYYLSEIIISPKFRGNGISRNLYSEHEKIAKCWGLSKFCLATVVRASDDPRKPKGYESTDSIWAILGYKKTPLEFNYEWPTIIDEENVKNLLNPMAFWIKS